MGARIASEDYSAIPGGKPWCILIPLYPIRLIPIPIKPNYLHFRTSTVLLYTGMSGAVYGRQIAELQFKVLNFSESHQKSRRHPDSNSVINDLEILMFGHSVG
ncbi:uncharacterized protein ARMOST_19114 [Armillaria ostoyae]|uniref:Uncharacterized protein n=1 Tax=Armillaria ostoyae TaxID=47428 RepID=A0A284S3M3_ARMOS|nr:uncharacterized protein ARMOST_19114 [Armillaria ostoyae]